MFNNNGPIVPKMPNKTGDTYAETRAEIEARKRAELAAEQAMLAAQNVSEKPKKSPWLAVLTIIFAAIALAGAGFAVYEYTENDKLKTELEKANQSYSSARTRIEELEKENTDLKTENDILKNQPADQTSESDQSEPTTPASDLVSD